MNTSELKLKLFRKIDTLEKSKLEQVYGLLLNLINTEDDTDIQEAAKSKMTSEEFENTLRDSYTIEEFSEKTTSFLESLSWKK